MLRSMFGMGGSEILVILIVALLFLGPDKLPEAAKQISKGIRDIKKQSRVLQRTIEDDEHIGGAIRDLKSALRGEDEPVAPSTKKGQIAQAAAIVALPSGDKTEEQPDAPAPTSTLMTDEEVAAHDAEHIRAAQAAELRMSATAGEPDDVPRTSAAEDAELAALVKPAANTIARGAAKPEPAAEPVAAPESEPKHG
jgi:sec-independent protein translocase protein TatB